MPPAIPRFFTWGGMLRYYRREAGLSSKDLAIRIKASGVAFTHQGVIRIEQGYCRPSVRVLHAISNILNWDNEQRAVALMLSAGLLRHDPGWVDPEEAIERIGA